MKFEVPFLDLQQPMAPLRPALDAAYRRVMDSGRYILGAEVERFEEDFAAVAGSTHAVGVGNGLDALAFLLHVDLALSLDLEQFNRRLLRLRHSGCSWDDRLLLGDDRGSGRLGRRGRRWRSARSQAVG